MFFWGRVADFGASWGLRLFGVWDLGVVDWGCR